LTMPDTAPVTAWASASPSFTSSFTSSTTWQKDCTTTQGICFCVFIFQFCQVDWQSSTKGMSQIWPEARQQSRNCLGSNFVLVTSRNSYGNFWLFSLKIWGLLDMSSWIHFAPHFFGRHSAKIRKNKKHCNNCSRIVFFSKKMHRFSFFCSDYNLRIDFWSSMDVLLSSGMWTSRFFNWCFVEGFSFVWQIS
jgi:hypothetical protein